MTYLLDTNICIYALKNTYPSLSQKLFQIHPDEIAVSAVTVSELEYGAAKSKWAQQTSFRMHMFLAAFTILPFSEQDAVKAGQIRAFLEEKGKIIGPYDIQIAAQGVSRGLIVVTHNTKEFSRVPDVRLEDWVSIEKFEHQ